MTQPVSNLQAEEAVIGALLMFPDRVREVDLAASEFFHPETRLAYECLTDMALVDGAPIDVLTVVDYAQEHKQHVPGEFLRMLGDWAARVPTAENLAFYAGIVRRCALKRRVELTLTRQLARVRAAEPTEIVQVTQELGTAVLTACDVRARFQRPAELFQTMLARLEAGPDATGRLLTGIRVVDELTGGIIVGHATMLGARTSMGKSCFARNVLDNLSARGIHGGYISLEDSPVDTMMWMALRRARVPIERVVHGLMLPDEFERIRACRADFERRPLVFCNEGSLTGQEIVHRAQQMIGDDGAQIIVVDFINRAKLPNERGRNEELSIYVVDPLCDLAVRKNVAVVVIAQLNRDAEKEQRPPQLTDFKDCGGIEESAEVALLIHRPARMKVDATKPRQMKLLDLIQAKNKQSEVGTAHCFFEGSFGYICDPPTPDFFEDGAGGGIAYCTKIGCDKLAIYGAGYCGLHLSDADTGRAPWMEGA